MVGHSGGMIRSPTEVLDRVTGRGESSLMTRWRGRRKAKGGASSLAHAIAETPTWLEGGGGAGGLA